jgi:hypothetical protein
LANRLGQMVHTCLPIDPDSLAPCLAPLIERIQYLESLA